MLYVGELRTSEPMMPFRSHRGPGIGWVGYDTALFVEDRFRFLGCARNDNLAVLSGTLGYSVTCWGLGMTFWQNGLVCGDMNERQEKAHD